MDVACVFVDAGKIPDSFVSQFFFQQKKILMVELGLIIIGTDEEDKSCVLFVADLPDAAQQLDLLILDDRRLFFPCVRTFLKFLFMFCPIAFAYLSLQMLPLD